MWDVLRSEGVYFTLLYFVLKQTLRGFTTKSPKREAIVKKAMIAYNVFMTLYSFVTFAVMLKLMLFDLSIYSEDCSHMFKNKTFRVTTYIFYMCVSYLLDSFLPSSTVYLSHTP
jgi:hypothetical protein